MANQSLTEDFKEFVTLLKENSVESFVWGFRPFGLKF